MAKNISDTIAKNFKTQVANIYNLTNVSILDKAEASSTPYNHNIVKETIIYFLFIPATNKIKTVDNKNATAVP